MTRPKSVCPQRMLRVSPPGDQARQQAFGHQDGRDPAAERRLRSLMTASAYAQAHIGALAEMYSREGRERTPEESAEMLALMRAQRERARQMNALADHYGWDVDRVSRLLAEKENTMTCPKCGAMLRPDAQFCGNCGARLEFSMAAARSGAGRAYDGARRVWRRWLP